MRDYLLSSEWVRFAFVLGVAVSMVLYEKRHLTTGSIVVPGYIAVFVIHPLVIAATFLNALLTYALVNLVLRRYVLLYGRTKFTVLALTSTVIQTAMLRLSPSGGWLWESDIPLFIGAGYIVPALIAHDMARQGVLKTTRSVMLAGVIVAIPIAVALALDLPGVNELAPVDGFGTLSITITWFPVAVMLSVIGSWAVSQNYGLRSGGFIGAAFTGMFMADPRQVLAALVLAGVTYLIVSRFLMKHMILFGRRKFSAMLLTSSALAWGGLWVGARFLDAEWEEYLGVGSLALTPLLLPGLLANDAQRTSPVRVGKGLVLAGTFAVTGTWWIQSVVSGLPLHEVWKIMAASMFVVLFAPQIVRVAVAVVAMIGRRVLRVRPVAAVVAHRSRTAARARTIERFGTAARRTTSGVAGAGAPSVMPWTQWASAHPDAARDAVSWLDAQLGRSITPAPWATLGPADTAPTSHTDRVTDAPATSMFDDVAAAVLQTALDRGRGAGRVPQRRVPTVYRDERGRLPLSEISETSDATPREAQLVASDASDHTPTDPIGPERREEPIRPIVDF